MNTQNGMELLDQALVRLYRAGTISKDTVFEYCNDRDEIGRITGERDQETNGGKGVNLNTQVE